MITENYESVFRKKSILCKRTAKQDDQTSSLPINIEFSLLDGVEQQNGSILN